MNSHIVETYTIIIGYGGITDLRSQITNNGNSIIEMTPLHYDKYDTRTAESDAIYSVGPPIVLTGGLYHFPSTALVGGIGGPIDGSGISSIRTGPDRSIFILTTTENLVGVTITPPISKRIQQWNGTSWISYCNSTPGACPLEGTC
jgi:hypothetical protein